MSRALARRGGGTMVPFAKAAGMLAAKKVYDNPQIVTAVAEKLYNFVARPKKVKKAKNLDMTLRNFNDNNAAVTSLNHYAGAPVSVGVRVASTKPRFTATKGGVTIQHRERVTDLSLVNGTSVASYAVNPFNPYLWPWLAGSADGYNKYKVNYIKMEYVPSCSTSQAGRIAMAWCADSSDSTPVFFELANFPSVANAPWMPSVLNIKGSIEKVIGDQSSSSSADKSLYNHGEIFIGVKGGSAIDAGEVFIDYSVTLLEPQPIVGYSTNVGLSHTSANAFWDTISTNDGWKVVAMAKSTGYSILLPAGTWKVSYYQVGTTLGAGAIDSAGGIVYSGNVTVIDSTATHKIMTFFCVSDGTGYLFPSTTDTFATQTVEQLRISKVSSYSYLTAGILT